MDLFGVAPKPQPCGGCVPLNNTSGPHVDVAIDRGGETCTRMMSGSRSRRLSISPRPVGKILIVKYGQNNTDSRGLAPQTRRSHPLSRRGPPYGEFRIQTTGSESRTRSQSL
jgi:hypothetical protein